MMMACCGLNNWSAVDSASPNLKRTLIKRGYGAAHRHRRHQSSARRTNLSTLTTLSVSLRSGFGPTRLAFSATLIQST